MIIDQISLKDYTHRKISLFPIMLAQQLVLLPLYFYIPVWIFLLNITVVLVMYFGQVKQKFTVPAWVKHIITLAAVAGIFISFQTLTGRDAGVALIATMYGLKIMEIKYQRDVYILMLLGFFLLLAGFLFDQSPWIAIYQFLPVAAILNALTSIHLLSPASDENQILGIVQQSFGSMIKQLLKYLVLAIPLMIILFVFFPRLSGPIWKMPGGAGASSGISDTMSPGEISSLQLSAEIAFRVRFDGKPPKGPDMYWRTLVLEDFDGLTWSRQADQKKPILSTTELNRRQGVQTNFENTKGFFQYEISMERTKQRWLTLLDRPVDIPKPAKLYSDYSVRTEHRLVDRTRYRAASIVRLQIGKELSREQRAKNTKIPEEGNLRSRDWAKQQRLLYKSDRDYITGVLSKIHQQEYFYTLSPPIMQRDSVDSFWFDEQVGFCEHYSGALVFLARAANIPARVVVGYQGAEKNTLSDYWIVRYANAHAWTEIWFEGEGWVRVDPTQAIARHRIEEQLLLDYSQRDGLFGDFGFDTIDLADIGWTKQVEYWLDRANTGWNDWILDYDKGSQSRIFKGLGLEKLTGQQIGILMVAIMAGFLTLFSLKWVKTKQKLDPIQASLQKLLNKLSKFGLALDKNQGVNSLIIEIQQGKSEILDAESHRNVIRLLKLYCFLRYQQQEISQKQQNTFRKQVNTFRIRIGKS